MCRLDLSAFPDALLPARPIKSPSAVEAGLRIGCN